MVGMGCSNITASVVMLHVGQAMLYQFYRNGVCYLENFGILRYRNGLIEIEPSQALIENLERMKTHREADVLCLLGTKIQEMKDLDDVQSGNSTRSDVGAAENVSSGASSDS